MIERRIRVPKAKADLVTRLTRSDEYPNGPFSQKSEVLVFAATYGYHLKLRRPFTETSDTIRFEVFERQQHDHVFYVLALAETEDPRILAATDETIDRRTLVFEEYANGGLEALGLELQGLPDPLERLALLVGEQRDPAESPKGPGMEDYLG